MASPELTKLSVDNAPTITSEGERAKASIAAARQKKNNTITSETLTPKPEFNLTQPKIPVQGAALGGVLETQTDQFQKGLEEQKAKTEQTRGSALDEYLKATRSQVGIEGFTAQEEKNQDFQTRSDELSDINNQILQEQNALRRAKEAIEKKGGGLAGGAAAEINNLERESLAKQADLSIIQLAKQARYDSARAMIDRKAKALYEQEQNTIDALRVNYEENRDLFNKAEQRLFETTLADRERKLNDERDNRKAIDSFALDALQNGAPTSVVERIQKATSMEEAIALGGEYLRPKTTGGQSVTLPSGEQVAVPTFEDYIAAREQELQMTLTPQKREELRAKYDAEIEVINQANTLAKLSPEAAAAVRDPKGFSMKTATEKGKVLDELARAGVDTSTITRGIKKQLPISATDDLAQAQIARNNVKTLFDMLKAVPGTGPIAGRIKALNPYDPQVAAIQAQITRTVPGLARGIFKEVGVLTDADVERYRQTLANLNFTDEQIEALNNDTMSAIDYSIKTTADTYDALGYDIGTFSLPDIQAKAPDNLTDEEAYAEYLKQSQK